MSILAALLLKIMLSAALLLKMILSVALLPEEVLSAALLSGMLTFVDCIAIDVADAFQVVEGPLDAWIWNRVDRKVVAPLNWR